MYYLSNRLCSKIYPTNIDIFYDGWVTGISLIITFDSPYGHIAGKIRVNRRPPDYNLWTSCDFEKCYKSYVGAKRGLLHYLHTFDHNDYKYDNSRFQKILTISNPNKKEITYDFIIENAYKAYLNNNAKTKITTCDIIEI